MNLTGGANADGYPETVPLLDAVNCEMLPDGSAMTNRRGAVILGNYDPAIPANADGNGRVALVVDSAPTLLAAGSLMILAVDTSKGNEIVRGAVVKPLVNESGALGVAEVAWADAEAATSPDGSLTVSLRVVRTGNANVAGTVKYRTSDGSAVAGDDYTAASGAVTFVKGQTEAAVTVSVTARPVTDVWFRVSLYDPSTGLTVGEPSSIVVSKVAAVTVHSDTLVSGAVTACARLVSGGPTKAVKLPVLGPRVNDAAPAVVLYGRTRNVSGYYALPVAARWGEKDWKLGLGLFPQSSVVSTPDAGSLGAWKWHWAEIQAARVAADNDGTGPVSLGMAVHRLGAVVVGADCSFFLARASHWGWGWRRLTWVWAGAPFTFRLTQGTAAVPFRDPFTDCRGQIVAQRWDETAGKARLVRWGSMSGDAVAMTARSLDPWNDGSSAVPVPMAPCRDATASWLVAYHGGHLWRVEDGFAGFTDLGAFDGPAVDALGWAPFETCYFSGRTRLLTQNGAGEPVVAFVDDDAFTVQRVFATGIAPTRAAGYWIGADWANWLTSGEADGPHERSLVPSTGSVGGGFPQPPTGLVAAAADPLLVGYSTLTGVM